MGGVSNLPGYIPVFPLPNLVLFPGVKVPLHIFEPRYCQMVADVSATHGLIGMMLLKGNWEEAYYRYPDVFAVGCAGRIDQLVRLPDGRFNLTLEGVSEFRVEREIRERSYRQAQIDWCPAHRAALELDDTGMSQLRELLAAYLGTPAEEAWKALVEHRGLRGADLINFLCFHLDLSALEKQTLLEALDSRIDCLFDMLTFKLEERKVGPEGRGGSGMVQ